MDILEEDKQDLIEVFLHKLRMVCVVADKTSYEREIRSDYGLKPIAPFRFTQIAWELFDLFRFWIPLESYWSIHLSLTILINIF